MRADFFKHWKWRRSNLCLVRSCILLWTALFTVVYLNASPVQIKDNSLILNGNLVQVNDDRGVVYLLVHGTWAHGQMEIISTLQTLLGEEGENSLAITLSLGVDNRSGFLDCENPITARHDAAIGEISLWVDYLSTRFSSVIIIGHSRGGNQVALFNQSHSKDSVKKLVLIAPMSWNKKYVELAYKQQFEMQLPPLITDAEKHIGGSLKGGIFNCKNVEINTDSFLSYYSSYPNRNTPDLLVNIDKPTLVILGSEDALSKKYQVSASKVKMGAMVEEVWIDGAGHFFRDFYADELVELLLKWVNE